MIMETTRVVQLAGVVFCLVVTISKVCYGYPSSYYSSLDEENMEQALAGVRGMLEEWERQGLLRSLMPSKTYLSNFGNSISGKSNTENGHEIMTRKSPRSGSNNNLRLRYGKRSNMPQYEPMGISSGIEEARAKSNGGGGGGGVNGNHGYWKVPSEQD